MDVANITASIRVDAATKKGSVIDVINMVTKNSLARNSVTQAVQAFETSCPDLFCRIDQLKINGKGRLTPVADARTLVEIVWLLPGKAAHEFRRSSATTVCRVLGGDLSLVQETLFKLGLGFLRSLMRLRVVH